MDPNVPGPMLGPHGQLHAVGQFGHHTGAVVRMAEVRDVGNDVDRGRTTARTATKRRRAARKHDGYWLSGGMYGCTACERVRCGDPY